MRCNCGVNPKYLTDQWLLAEQVEILMVAGYLKRMNFKPKGEIPKEMNMGKGYILFWCNKMEYLNRRHEAVKEEICRRDFKVTDVCLRDYDIPAYFWNLWEPTKRDTNILRKRLFDKMMAKKDIWRYYRMPVQDPHVFIQKVVLSKLYYV